MSILRNAKYRCGMRKNTENSAVLLQNNIITLTLKLTLTIIITVTTDPNL